MGEIIIRAHLMFVFALSEKLNLTPDWVKLIYGYNPSRSEESSLEGEWIYDYDLPVKRSPGLYAVRHSITTWMATSYKCKGAPFKVALSELASYQRNSKFLLKPIRHARLLLVRLTSEGIIERLLETSQLKSGYHEVGQMILSQNLHHGRQSIFPSQIFS